MTGLKVYRDRQDWWHVDKVAPGEVRARSINDVGENALKLTKNYEEAKLRGQLLGISPRENVEFHTVIVFRATFLREVDKKRYERIKTVLVLTDSKTGKPIVWDAELMAQAFPFLHGLLRSGSQEERGR